MPGWHRYGPLMATETPDLQETQVGPFPRMDFAALDERNMAMIIMSYALDSLYERSKDMKVCIN